MTLDVAAWWTWPIQTAVLPRRPVHRLSNAPPRENADERRVRRLDTLAEVASQAWAAINERELFDAIAHGCARLGLNAHLGIADAHGDYLVVRRFVLAAGGEEVERILGGTPLGRRIALDVPTPYRQVYRLGSVERMIAPLLWMRLALPNLDQEQAVAAARRIQMGAVALAPITDGEMTLGVLTVWAPALADADLSGAQMLARIAGGALSALRAAR